MTVVDSQGTKQKVFVSFMRRDEELLVVVSRMDCDHKLWAQESMKKSLSRGVM